MAMSLTSRWRGMATSALSTSAFGGAEVKAGAGGPETSTGVGGLTTPRTESQGPSAHSRNHTPGTMEHARTTDGGGSLPPDP